MLSLLSLLPLALAAPQAPSSTPISAAGALAGSLTSTWHEPSATAEALNPSPSLNGSAEVDDLWKDVEVYFPVQTAAITSVVEVPKNYSYGQDPPPYRPEYVQYTTSGMKFRPGFLWGFASAATQVEGATKTDGKGPSTWDLMCHHWPTTQCNGFDTDITDNHYYMYKQDLARMKHLGMNAYSFSVAWTRIFPLGSGAINEAGLKFYEDLVEATIAAGMEPVVTLNHWDTPLSLVRRYGAFADIGDQIVTDFAAYAKVVFERLGKRVKKWITFNEPRVYCGRISGRLPYNLTYPEGINATSAHWRCVYNLLKSHGHAVHAYRELIKEGKIPAGEIAIKNDDYYPLPWDPKDPEDARSAERHFQFAIGLWSQPIYGDGNYPKLVVDTLGSFLPPLSAEDKKYIKGSADFYAIDAYRTDISKSAIGGIDNCLKNVVDPRWPVCEETANIYQVARWNGWSVGPTPDPKAAWDINSHRYLRMQLKTLQKNFPSKGGIYITEYGMAEPLEYMKPELYMIKWDANRAQYFTDYVNEALLAVHEDGIDLRGMFAWSLVDNFEWNSGMQQRFGIMYVNTTDPQLPREYKLSAFVLRDLGKAHL